MKTQDERLAELDRITLRDARDGLILLIYKHPETWDTFVQIIERRESPA